MHVSRLTDFYRHRLILLLITAPLWLPADGTLPVGVHFTFNGTLEDTGPQGNALLLEGQAVLDEGDMMRGDGNGALHLDGNGGSRARLAEPLQFTASEPWSVTWWARRNELGGSRGMVMGERNSLGNFIWLNDSQRGLRFRNGLAASLDFYAPKDSGLHHYALVADGLGSLHLYLDGVHSETLEGETDFVVDSIGQGYTAAQTLYGFNGWLDEIRIFAAELTAEQIAALYEEEKPRAAPAVPRRVAVFLLGGQSNAVGHGIANELPRAPVNLFFPQEDVDFYYHFPNGPFVHTTVRAGVSRIGSFGPEIGMALQLKEYFPEDGDTRVAIIKYANGGTNLHTQWRGDGTSAAAADGPEYQAFQETVARGLTSLSQAYPDAEIEIMGMAWMQGESDRDPRFNVLYEDNLRRFIADVRATVRIDLPFVIGRLSVNQTAIPPEQLGVIQQAQDRVAATHPLTGVVNTDAWGMLNDNIHFNSEGLLNMGRAFAKALMYRNWVDDAQEAGLLQPWRSDPGDASLISGLSNQELYVMDWRRATGDGEPSALPGRIGWAAPGGPGLRLQFASSSGRIYQLETFNPVSGEWEPEGEPWRGREGLDSLSVNPVSPVMWFRLAISLPTSQF